MAILTITDEQRSMIASAFVASRKDTPASLCCYRKLELCAAIVGDDFAVALSKWMYNETGCGSFDDADFEEKTVQRFLDKISQLEEIDSEYDEEWQPDTEVDDG